MTFIDIDERPVLETIKNGRAKDASVGSWFRTSVDVSTAKHASCGAPLIREAFVVVLLKIWLIMVPEWLLEKQFTPALVILDNSEMLNNIMTMLNKNS